MLCPYLRNIIIKPKLPLKIITHFRKSLLFFIPAIASQAYVIVSRLILGNLTNLTEVGLYQNADSLVRILVTVLSAISTVMMPRISNLYSEENHFKL